MTTKMLESPMAAAAMTLTRVAGATHWIVHERPALVAAEIERALAR